MAEVKNGFYAKRFNIGGLQEERIVRCLKIFSRLQGDRLLDIGCGDGAVTMALKQAMGAEEAYGIDIAPQAVAAAMEKGVRAFQIDIEGNELPFADEYLDIVYCGEIVEHVFDTDHLFEEVGRVLKPGGLCILTTPNLAGWPNRFALLLGFQPFPTAVSPRHEGLGKLLLAEEEGQWGHIRVFTLRALTQLVGLYGFSIVRIEGCPVTLNTKHWAGPFVRAWDRLMAKFPSLANRVILVLKKT